MARKKAKTRELLRAAADELGLTRPAAIERQPPGRRARPAKGRVRTKSLRAGGD